MGRKGLVLAMVLTGACAGGAQQTSPVTEEPGGAPIEAPYELPVPEVVAVAPGAVAVGDKVQVIGTGFVPAEHGDMRLRFAGFYSTEGGQRIEYKQDIPLKYVNPGLAEFEFGPKIVFSSSGEELGAYSGIVMVINRATELDAEGKTVENASKATQIRMETKPSIIIDQIRSIDGSCSAITKGTVPDANLAFGFHAIGIGSATEQKPMKVRIQMDSPTVTATYVKDEGWLGQNWPPITYPSDATRASTGAGTASMTTTIKSGSGLTLEPTHGAPLVFEVAPQVTIGGQTLSTARLLSLRTGSFGAENQFQGKTSSFIVTVETADGEKVVRGFQYKVHPRTEVMPYDGNKKLVERYEAQPVSGCFAGGGTGLQYSFSESESESQQRTVGFQWDTNTQFNAGLSAGANLFGLIEFSANTGMSWSASFGVNSSTASSKEKSNSQSLQLQLLPNTFAMSYRQTEKYEKSVDLVLHTECGDEVAVGKAVMTDWDWGMDIATGPACPPVTKLPPAWRAE